MKKIILSMLALAALAGCSKSEEGTQGGNGGPEGLVPIRLGSGVAMVTKAPMTDATSFTAGIAGWENTATEDYAGNPTWSTTIQTVPPVPTKPQEMDVTWTAQKYYNADEGTTTYMKAWYPAGTLSGTTVTFNNTDASVDALLAPVVSGTKLTKDAPDKVLAFAHQTTQINFKVQAGEGLAAGTQIKTIKVKNTAVPASITLGNVTGSVDATVVNYTGKSELDVPNIAVAEISQTATVVGDPLMVKPVDDNTTVTLYIETVQADGTTTAAIYDDVAQTTSDSKLTRGSAYTVTLTFKQAGISLEANITPWTEAMGQGEVI